MDCTLPLCLRHRDLHYWFTYLDETGLLYIKYNSCREMEGKPFASFADEVLGYIDNHPVQRLVFDLRHNRGGSSALARGLISGIKDRAGINRKGRLFVVVGRETFSSAILNALELTGDGNATLAGEATGGKPNHYGEVRFFKLPNSMLSVQYSTKDFSLWPDDVASLYPDLYAEPTFADLLACRDPVLEAILAYEPASTTTGP
jgi:hypothetical protein